MDSTSKSIIPGKTVFSIKREGTKKVRIVGCGNFQEDSGLAVFTVNVDVITVRVVMLISSLLGWFVTGVDVKTAFLHASPDGQEDIYVRPPPCPVGVSLRRVPCGGSRRVFMGFVQLRDSGVSQGILFSLRW